MPYPPFKPEPYGGNLKEAPFAKRHREQYRPDRPIIPRYTAPPKGMYFTRENYFPPTPADPQEEAAAQMKNYERLTPFERKLYNWLPGFAESTVGKAVARFGGSWVGNALSKLDVGAEAVERGLGLMDQWNEARANPDPNAWKEFQENLNSAWYAGSLFGDVTNLHTWDSDNNRFTVPTDLPGTAALVQARNRIEELTNQCIDPGDALVQVREELYEDQGALGLRSQLYDTYWHMIADPLNLLTVVKPVQLVQKTAKIAGATKIADSLLDEARLAIKTAETAGNMVDIVAQAEKWGTLTDITRTALKTAEAEGNFAKAAKIAREALGTNALTMTDKFALLLAGGDPFKMPTTSWGRSEERRVGEEGRSRWAPYH